MRHVDPRHLAAPRPAPASPDAPARAADWLDLLRLEGDGLSGWSLERLLDRLEGRS